VASCLAHLSTLANSRVVAQHAHSPRQMLALPLPKFLVVAMLNC